MPKSIESLTLEDAQKENIGKLIDLALELHNDITPGEGGGFRDKDKREMIRGLLEVAREKYRNGEVTDCHCLDPYIERHGAF